MIDEKEFLSGITDWNKIMQEEYVERIRMEAENRLGKASIFPISRAGHA